MHQPEPCASGTTTTNPAEVPAGAATPWSSGSWFGQPKGLTILFLTEMWEKFSFFGMRVLQVYYMTKELHFSQSDASLVFGLYGGGVYLTPILGGVIADRWLGRKRAVVSGGSLMAVGHFMMTFEPLFFPAMVVIALGNGLFLPSLPSQVKDLYAPDDPRRSGAFNVYYVGVNLGALLAPLVCGTLGELYGWHYGFGAAGIGMCVGLVVYLSGSRYLPGDKPAIREATPAPAGGTRSVVFALVAVGLAVVVFRSAYEQYGNAIALWSDSDVDRRIGTSTIPVTWFQALNPLFVFLFTPLLIVAWRRAATRGRDLSAIRKMAVGAFLTAVAFGLLAGLSYVHQGTDTKTLWPWLVVFFAIQTMGELYILPSGVGLFARLAPTGFGATLIAAWFLASFAGNLLSGVVGSVYSHVTPAVFFLAMAGITTLSSLLLYLADPLGRRAEASSAARIPTRRLSTEVSP